MQNSKSRPSSLSAELESKLEASLSAQEQLEKQVERTAADVEEVKTTVSKGKAASGLDAAGGEHPSHFEYHLVICYSIRHGGLFCGARGEPEAHRTFSDWD